MIKVLQILALVFCSAVYISCSDTSLSANSLNEEENKPVDFSDLVLHKITAENTSHFDRRALHAVYTHRVVLPSILNTLNAAFIKNFGDWTKAIDETFYTLQDSQPKMLEKLVNQHMIAVHPFHDFINIPFTSDCITPDRPLSEYFNLTEYSALYLQLLNIRTAQTESPAAYSASHISLLNVLYKYAELLDSDADRLHMAFIFRATFYNYDLVIDSLLDSIFNSQSLLPSYMAQDLHAALHAQNPEFARLALKSCVVQTCNADYSHFSYSETIENYLESGRVPLLPADLKTALESDHFDQMNLGEAQRHVIYNLQSSYSGDHLQSALFWVAYSIYFTDPSKFSHDSSWSFWFSFFYSLTATFSQLFPASAPLLFEIPNYLQLLDSLCEPLVLNREFLLSIGNLRGMILVGHIPTIQILFSVYDPVSVSQSDADSLLKFASVYGPPSSIAFLFSIKKIKDNFSEKALNSAFLRLCAQGKTSALKTLLNAFFGLVVDGLFDADKAFKLAASHGLIDTLHVLSSSTCLSYSESTLIAIFTTAFNQKHFKILDLMVLYSHNLKLDIRKLPFVFQLFGEDAAYNTCQTIINTEFFEDVEVYEMVLHASEAAFIYAKPAILDYILVESEMFITPQIQDLILEKALQGNYLDSKLFKTIFCECGFQFTDAMRSRAIEYALNGHHADLVLPIFLKDDQFRPKTDVLHLSLIAALQVNRTDLFKKIANAYHDALSTQVLANFVKEAQNSNKPELVQSLIRATTPALFSPSVQNDYLKNATSLEEIKFVANCGFRFSALVQRQVLNKAHRQNNKEITDFLISSPRFQLKRFKQIIEEPKTK